jgi:predicted  nucleic acid-binding Zn-ribbon protein
VSGTLDRTYGDFRSRLCGGVTTEDDVSALAGQLADLTRVVDDLAGQVTALRERATNQQEAADAQQERIEVAARELADVSSRLQLAADALRSAL